MKNYNIILLALAALFFVTSCALEEMPGLFGPEEGEEVVMSFRPKFDDFESVTKAIGKGERVDELLVQVYENGGSKPISSVVYEKSEWGAIDIPFYYGKKYQVYFWAYNSENDPYTITDAGLKGGVSVGYPDGALAYDALEILDAFYAVKDVDLSTNDDTRVNVSLTRPFAQVNLVADKAELLNAKATKVEFEINAANSFVPGAADAISTTGVTFTFKSDNSFQDNEEITAGKVYLGTTYLFVPSSGSLEAKVTLYDSMDNKLKGPSSVTIPLASNQRTNLVFTGVEPAWDDDAMDVPDDVSDGWIHIETPEQMAAFLLDGPAEGAKVHVCHDINMGGLPQKYHEAIAARTFTDLTLYGGALENGNPTTGGGSHMISNFTAPAFLANATNLTVSDLVLDNFNIGGNSHVGTLVNTLKGSSTFTNVTVSNSSATTSNGAAGGVVGYMVRKSEKDRAENMEVKFDGCSIVGSEAMNIATGTLAEGKFVGLLSGYDNGEKLVFTDCSADYNTTVADYASRYTEGNESTWQSDNDYTTYDGFLGDEKYLRAKVYFGGEDEATNRFCPKWDGKKPTYDLIVESNSKLVFSPYDLALLQEDIDPKTPLVTHSSVTFVNNVDMASKVFVPITKITNLYGNNFTIYNLKVDTMQDEANSYGGAFMRNTGGGEHKDLTFDNADIKVVHDPNGSTGNAYGGILSAAVSSTHTISNVHVKNSKLYAVCKMGGLVGRVHGGTFTCTGCTVDNCILENYNAKDDDVFDISKEVSGVTATAYAVFGTSGEAGGLIGFLCTTANISDCAVTNTIMNCFGQRDQEIKLTANVSGIQGAGYFLVAGRHVNEFIGDIRTIYGENISISKCSVDSNTYGVKSTEGDATHPSNLHNCHFYEASRSCVTQKSASSAGWLPDYDYWFKYDVKKYTPLVGCVYYVGVDYGSIHIADTRGKVTIDNLVLDSIDEFVGGSLNNILDVGIAPLWGQLKNLKTEIVLSGSYK